MIESNGYCLHVYGGHPSYCIKHSSTSIARCEEKCSYRSSCVGFVYHYGQGICVFFTSDGTCPSGFSFNSEDHTAETANDLVGDNYPGYVCYGKNSGIGILQFKKSIKLCWLLIKVSKFVP